MPTRRLASVLATFLCLLVVPIGAQQGTAPPDAPHVVLISLDGFTARALQDPAIPLPNLRRLAAAGATAKAMQPVNPTVTWANHTSMVTGVTPAGHGVVYNGLLVREPGAAPHIEQWRDRDEMVHAPTLYDAVHQKGMTTAQVDWVAIWNAPTVTWEFRERVDPANPVSQALVAQKLITQEDLENFGSRNIVFRDRAWTDAAKEIIREHKPNLMMFHLLTLDSVQHRYGPDTLAAQSTMAHLDSLVGEIVAAVDEAGLTPRTTFVVASDHGFRKVEQQINPNVALARAGLIEVSNGKPAKVEGWVVPEGGTAIGYVTVDDPDGSRLAKMKEVLGALEGVDQVIDPSGYAALGFPAPTPESQMGQLLLTAKPGYAFTGAVTGEPVNPARDGSLGSHGYLASDPQLGAIFIASGRGIKPGVVLDSVRTIDLAPTMARLLGVELAKTDGRVLTEVLGEQ